MIPEQPAHFIPDEYGCQDFSPGLTYKGGENIFSHALAVRFPAVEAPLFRRSHRNSCRNESVERGGATEGAVCAPMLG
jgi:hypothetical protein